MVMGVLLATLAACEATQPRERPGVAPAQERAPAPESRPATTQPATSQWATSQPAVEDPAKKQKDEAKKARERQRKLAKLERSLETAGLNLEKTKLSAAHAERQFRDAAGKAEADLDLARTKYENFLEIALPNRIARAELGLQGAEDGATEAREELDQLEQMYSDEQFADATKEIVVERARRRLERTQRDLELRREEFRTLVENTLPIEQWELELGVQEKERGLAQLRRGRETTVIDQNVATMNAEAEITRLENELSDVQEEIAEAGSKPADPPAGAQETSP
jgi:hypothetical protein